jgi:hypothetical protein
MVIHQQRRPPGSAHAPSTASRFADRPFAPPRRAAGPPSPRGPVVQRVYLDNQTKLEEDLQTQDGEVSGPLLEAMQRYRELDSQIALPLVNVVNSPGLNADPLVDVSPLVIALQQVVQLAQPHLESEAPGLARIARLLGREADLVASDLEFYAALAPQMDQEPWQRNPDNIVEAGRQILTRYPKYLITWRADENATIYRGLTRLRDKKVALEQRWEDEWAVDGKLGYQWGDETGQLSEEDNLMLADFDALKNFVDNKPLVLAHLRPLADTIREAPDKLAALRSALRMKEAEAGFAEPPKIPLGILPTESFFGLLRGGQVLDDYGVGLKHGELTHRLQWYAVIDAAGSDLTVTNTPFQLYRLMGREPRSGDPKWGDIFDLGNEVNSGTYSSPATLNRDLQESAGLTDGTALPPRPEYIVPQGLDNLEPIGQALASLRQKRLTQASGALDKGNDFEDEAFPPPSRVNALVDQMSQRPEAFSLRESDEVGHEFMETRSRYQVWNQLTEETDTNSLSWGDQELVQQSSSWPSPWAVAAGLGGVFLLALYLYNRKR